MKKNILFWIGVRSNDELLQQKHGGFKYLDISKQSWQYWCNKNDIIFYEYHTSSESDTRAHRATWTRWFDVFPLIDELNIEFDKIAVVDGSTIIKWDALNFFDTCTANLTAFRSLENVGWIYEGVRGYKHMFNDFDFDLAKYIDCGFQVFTKKHRQFLEDLKKFYYINYDKIMELQSTVKKGTDQPVYNYLLQVMNVPVDMNIHPSYNLNHLHRFDWFHYNWQLNEDNTPFFIKYGNIWKYSGFPNRGDRFNLMSQTWEIVKHNYES
jgi:hypothetical protein